MKFEPLFKSEKNQLVKIEDGVLFSTENLSSVDAETAAGGNAPVPEDKKILTAVKAEWEKIDLGGENYNEELLAGLRDYLKNLEEKGQFAFIVPSTKKEIPDADTADSYIKAMVHTARRIKDCVSVIGFAVPDELLAKDSELDENSYSQWFVNEMNVKHGHYVYFVNKDALNRCGLTEKAERSSFILY